MPTPWSNIGMEIKMSKFESILNEAFGIVTEEDAKPVKPKGQKRKSSDGPHLLGRKGTEYTELDREDEFSAGKPVPELTKQARPDLPK